MKIHYKIRAIFNINVILLIRFSIIILMIFIYYFVLKYIFDDFINKIAN